MQANQNVEFQVKEPSTVKMTDAHTKGDQAEAAQEDNQKKLQVKDNSHQDNSHQQNPAHTVADKRRKPGGEHKHMDIPLPQGRQVNKTRLKTTDHIGAVSTKLLGDAKVGEKPSVMNGATDSKDSALMRCQSAAGGIKLQIPRGSATEGKAVEGSQVDGKPVETHLAIGHMSTPIIRLESLSVKDSCDEMPSMEIR